DDPEGVAVFALVRLDPPECSLMLFPRPDPAKPAHDRYSVGVPKELVEVAIVPVAQTQPFCFRNCFSHGAWLLPRRSPRWLRPNARCGYGSRGWRSGCNRCR